MESKKLRRFKASTNGCCFVPRYCIFFPWTLHNFIAGYFRGLFFFSYFPSTFFLFPASLEMKDCFCLCGVGNLKYSEISSFCACPRKYCNGTSRVTVQFTNNTNGAQENQEKKTFQAKSTLGTPWVSFVVRFFFFFFLFVQTHLPCVFHSQSTSNHQLNREGVIADTLLCRTFFFFRLVAL